MKRRLSLYSPDSENSFTHIFRRGGGGNGYIINLANEPVDNVSMLAVLYHHRKDAHFDLSTLPKVISPFLTPSVDEGA